MYIESTCTSQPSTLLNIKELGDVISLPSYDKNYKTPLPVFVSNIDNCMTNAAIQDQQNNKEYDNNQLPSRKRKLESDHYNTSAPDAISKRESESHKLRNISCLALQIVEEEISSLYKKIESLKEKKIQILQIIESE